MIARVLLFPLAVASLWFSSGSSFAQSPAPEQPLTLEQGVAAHAGVDAIYARFNAAYKALDPAAVANLYTESAAYLAPDAELEIGRNKVLAEFERFFGGVKQKGGRIEITFRVVQRKMSGDLGYDVGIFNLTRVQESGESRTSRGKFFVVTVKDTDGTWRFQADGYNHLPKPK